MKLVSPSVLGPVGLLDGHLGPLGFGWSPLALSPYLWVDFSLPSSLFTTSGGSTTVAADGDLIGRAQDRSGHGQHLAVSGAVPSPTWKVNVQNGRAAALFDGAGDFLTRTFGATLTQPTTICTVARSLSSGTRVLYDGIGSGNRHQLYQDGGNLWLNAGTALTTGVAVPGAAFLSTAVFNGASSRFRLDGAEVSPGNLGAHSLTGLVLGSYFGTNLVYWHGYVCEVLIFLGLLAAADLLRLEAYLKAKWGTP